MIENSCTLYKGRVTHLRLRPRRHHLSYRVFWLLLDIDNIDTSRSGLRLFSHNRFNLLSFFERDYGDGTNAPLRAQVEVTLAKAAISLDGGRIRLFTMPRIFGYAFNPLSVYFCYGPSGELVATIYEVNNTFGERHSYLIPIPHDKSRDASISQHAPKEFFVSPFLGMDMAYDFCVSASEKSISLSITGSDANGPVITANLSGTSEPMNDFSLLKVFATCPFFTLKVTVGIFWEAMFLWLKGVPLQSRPFCLNHQVTVVTSDGFSVRPFAPHKLQ